MKSIWLPDKITDKNGDQFTTIDGKWYWIDLDDEYVGPFDTKEEAREDAYDNFWLKTQGE